MTTACVTLLTSLLTLSEEPAVKEPPAERVRVRTSDGALLEGLRHRRDGAPVILLHGLVASLHQFDLVDEESPCLARFLSSRGWDVWLFNWRGAGRGPLRSALPPGQRRWSADELIVEDLPAIVARVRRATGERPYLIGHSLGGMSIAAWLCGATKIDAHDVKKGVRIDIGDARRRNAEVRGAVFLSAPARLSWSEGRRPKEMTRLAEIGRAPLRLLLPARIPLSDLNGSLGDGDGSSLLEKTGDRIQSLLDSIFGKTSWSALAFGPRTGRRARDLLRKMRGGVLGDTSEDLLLQLAAGAREGTWPSWRGPPDARVDYAAHYHNITTAVLAAVGSEDRIADSSVIRSELIDRLGSEDRKALVIDGYGHSDITLDASAHVDVFTPVESWLRSRMPAAGKKAPAAPGSRARKAEKPGAQEPKRQ